MTIAPLRSRDRLNLAQKSLRATQTWTYAASFACLAVAVFADPQHRLAIAALNLFTVLFHAIVH